MISKLSVCVFETISGESYNNILKRLTVSLSHRCIPYIRKLVGLIMMILLYYQCNQSLFKKKKKKKKKVKKKTRLEIKYFLKLPYLLYSTVRPFRKVILWKNLTMATVEPSNQEIELIQSTI